MSLSIFKNNKKLVHKKQLEYLIPPSYFTTLIDHENQTHYTTLFKNRNKLFYSWKLTTHKINQRKLL